MSVSVQELDDFTRFVRWAIATGDAKLELEDCLRLWRQKCDQEATIHDIRQGRLDHENGLAIPLAEAFADVRWILGVER